MHGKCGKIVDLNELIKDKNNHDRKIETEKEINDKTKRKKK